MNGIPEADDLDLSAYFQHREELDSSPPLQTIPLYDPKDYADKFIHGHTRKLPDFPDLSENEN